MSRKFVLERYYYDVGVNLYKKKSVTINSGVTVLVGCNGIGKTTLLHQIRDRLKTLNIPYIDYDNLSEGGNNSMSGALYNNDLSFLATAFQSSEGENIVLNIQKLATELANFIKTGKTKNKNPFADIFKSLNEEDIKEKEIPSERWILLDAVDSGLSVDNIVDVKDFFKAVTEYNYGNDIYILVSANEYEMARGEQCFDVYNGKYLIFKDYEEYRNMILESKKRKEERESTAKEIKKRIVNVGVSK